MTELDPRLVGPTCLYLATKAEECTVQARLLVFYIKKLCKELDLFVNLSNSCVRHSQVHCIILFTDSDEKYRYEIKDILEMEMKILEALNYYLVVFHPYRPLSQ